VNRLLYFLLIYDLIINWAFIANNWVVWLLLVQMLMIVHLTTDPKNFFAKAHYVRHIYGQINVFRYNNGHIALLQKIYLETQCAIED
jgi:hypothetical protein